MAYRIVASSTASAAGWSHPMRSVPLIVSVVVGGLVTTGGEGGELPPHAAKVQLASAIDNQRIGLGYSRAPRPTQATRDRRRVCRRGQSASTAANTDASDRVLAAA